MNLPLESHLRVVQLSIESSPWIIAAGLSTVTAFSSWCYLQSLKIVPAINLLMLTTGLALLAFSLKPVGQSVEISSPLWCAAGLVCVVLAAAGTRTIQQIRLRERLRRRLWEEVARRQEDAR